MLKKIKFLVLTTLVLFSTLTILPINSNAIKLPTWSTKKYGRTISYSFVQRLYSSDMYYGLRGRMWMYSGDTLGFEYAYSFPFDSEDEAWKLKVKAKVTRGKGNVKMSSEFCWDDECTGIMHKNSWTKKAYGIGQYMHLRYGLLNVISKNGCTVKLTYSVKRAKSLLWRHKSFKIKVKKIK
jgi:hypothetical protein